MPLPRRSRRSDLLGAPTTGSRASRPARSHGSRSRVRSPPSRRCSSSTSRPRVSTRPTCGSSPTCSPTSPTSSTPPSSARPTIQPSSSTQTTSCHSIEWPEPKDPAPQDVRAASGRVAARTANSQPTRLQPPAAGERLTDPQPEALEQLGNALELEVMAVALAERGQLIRVRVDRAAHVGELPEEVLEARGRDDLEDPARLVARVPEGVPLVARLEDEVAGTCLHDVVPEQGAHAPLEHEAVLVLARVEVQRRRERARGHRMLDEREALLRLVAVDHESHADAAEKTLHAVVGTDDPRSYCRCFHR